MALTIVGTGERPLDGPVHIMVLGVDRLARDTVGKLIIQALRNAGIEPRFVTAEGDAIIKEAGIQRVKRNGVGLEVRNG